MTVSQVQVQGVTRGNGLLEVFLASRRARAANRLIPPDARSGRLLDIGCGCEPYFLARTEFARKCGVDKVVEQGAGSAPSQHTGLRLSHFDIDQCQRLPFESNTFDAVTMLAVFEHIRRERLLLLIDDIDRILRPGGVYVMTTPAGWTAPILTLLKYLRLVSAVEIDDHEDAYSRKNIRSVIGGTAMKEHSMRFGSFECMMNTWLLVRKPRAQTG